jgi:hypothetical protein
VVMIVDWTKMVDVRVVAGWLVFDVALFVVEAAVVVTLVVPVLLEGAFAKVLPLMRVGVKEAGVDIAAR